MSVLFSSAAVGSKDPARSTSQVFWSTTPVTGRSFSRCSFSTAVRVAAPNWLLASYVAR
jgi:hypothetical protein